MDKMKQKFAEKASQTYEELIKLRKDYGDTVIADVKIEQVMSGMKGVPSLLTLTSKLDPQEGIRFRGYSIPELQKLLPKAPGGTEPLPEGLFYLMLLDELPTEQDVKDLSAEWMQRSYVPHHVFRVIDSLPKTSRPMTQFSTGILAWATESRFQKAYRDGINKKDYWDYTYEDVMNFLAALPRLAAYIYRRNYRDNNHIAPHHQLDWSANFAHMMGYDDPDIHKLMRLYLFIHADHEGGNVSAHTTHLVGSALSNIFYSYAAGMLGLAGPLHGYANQEVIRWVNGMLEQLGTQEPTNKQVEDYVHKTLNDGKVIPGYGHAVLRKTDPRYMAQREFAQRNVNEDPFIRVVDQLYEVVPPILGSLGKVKNPWPNVDAYSGSLLMHYGIKEHNFYTVMFGVSRALGVLASMVWDRALGLPIERPTSHLLSWYKDKAGMK